METCNVCSDDLDESEQGGTLCHNCWEVSHRIEGMNPIHLARILQMSNFEFIAIQVAFTQLYLLENH